MGARTAFQQRYIHQQAAKTNLSRCIVIAHTLYHRLLNQLKALKSFPSQLNRKELSLMAMLHLALENRVAYSVLINNVLDGD